MTSRSTITGIDVSTQSWKAERIAALEMIFEPASVCNQDRCLREKLIRWINISKADDGETSSLWFLYFMQHSLRRARVKSHIQITAFVASQLFILLRSGDAVPLYDVTTMAQETFQIHLSYFFMRFWRKSEWNPNVPTNAAEDVSWEQRSVWCWWISWWMSSHRLWRPARSHISPRLKPKSFPPFSKQVKDVWSNSNNSSKNKASNISIKLNICSDALNSESGARVAQRFGAPCCGGGHPGGLQ